MDVSAVGHTNHAQGPLTAVAAQQQATPPSAQPEEAGEDSVEISTDAKTLATQSVVDK